MQNGRWGFDCQIGGAKSGTVLPRPDSDVSVTGAYFSSPTDQLSRQTILAQSLRGTAAIVSLTGIGMNAIHNVSDTNIMKAGTELFSRVGTYLSVGLDAYCRFHTMRGHLQQSSL
jgi:hypothetical protein